MNTPQIAPIARRNLLLAALSTAIAGPALDKGDSGTIKAFHTNKAILDEAIDGKLAAITIPTLVVWGEHDRLIPLADGQSYASGIAGARLVVIPDSGHAPMIETPAAFLRAVQPFL